MTDLRPSADEYAARRSRLGTRLRDDGIDVCLVLAPESQCWLCGLESFISGVLPQALVVPADEREPMVLVVWDADRPLAQETSVVGDIRTYRFGVDDPVAAFTTVLADRAPDAQVVGLDGSSRAVPHALGAALVERIGASRAVDCSTALADVRLVKSPFELECLRSAGRFADIGLQAALATARPGVSERRLAAEIEHAMRKAGSDYPSIPTELTSGPRSVFGHGTPSHRLLEAGDLVHVEIGGVEARYNAVGLQTFCVGGAPPSPVGARLYDDALACLRAGLDAVRPGVEARAVEAPALEVLRAAGRGEVFKMRFGYGVGIG